MGTFLKIDFVHFTDQIWTHLKNRKNLISQEPLMLLKQIFPHMIASVQEISGKKIKLSVSQGNNLQTRMCFSILVCEIRFSGPNSMKLSEFVEINNINHQLKFV